MEGIEALLSKSGVVIDFVHFKIHLKCSTMHRFLHIIFLNMLRFSGNIQENHLEVVQKILKGLYSAQGLNTILLSCYLMGSDGQFHNLKELEVPKT